MTPCPNHGPEFICTECTVGPEDSMGSDKPCTDGRGFPHPSVARGRRRLQRCRICKGMVEDCDYTNDIRNCVWGHHECALRKLDALAKASG